MTGDLLAPSAVAFGLLLPIGIGALAAKRGRRGGLALAAGIASLLALSALWAGSPPPSEWLGFGLTAALAHGVLRPPASRRARLLLGLALFLSVSELGTRALLGPAPTMISDLMPWTPRASRVAHGVGARSAQQACDLLHHTPPAPEGRWVLHLGDSMVRGTDETRPGAGLARAWSQHIPAIAHTPRAALGTSVDVHRIALRHALTQEPSVVLWYLNPFNDDLELHKRYGCCADGPVLDDHLEPRCPLPTAVRASLRRTATAPWLLRVSATRSAAAGWVLVGWARAFAFHPYAEPSPWSEVARVVQAGVQETIAAGVPIALVVLPDIGRQLRGHDTGQRAALVEALEARGLAALPGVAIWQPAFPDALPKLTALTTQDRIHLRDPEGYDHLAGTMAEALRALRPD